MSEDVTLLHQPAAEISAEALQRAEEMIEREEGVQNRLAGLLAGLVTTVAVVMSLFHLYAAYAIVRPEHLRAIHVAFVLFLSFLLLLVAFRSLVIPIKAILLNLLSTAAAFGVAKLIFQDGHLSGLLGFESQGFLDAWGPIFFFAMIFAIAMDYTVFLLSSAREH